MSDSAQEHSPEVTPVTAVARAAAHSERVTSLHYRITGFLPEQGRVNAEASMRTEPLTMSMKMNTTDPGEDSRLEFRFVDEVMYVSGNAVDSRMIEGKSWLSAEPAVWGLGSADNNSYGMLPRQLEGTPAVQAGMLTASKNLRRIGTETIDGTRTTHYRGTVTGRGIRAARDAAADKADRERQINNLDQFNALRVEGTLTVDLWIGDADLTKQFRMRGATYAAQGGTEGRPLEFVDGDPLDMTITFLDVDQPVTVEAPPSEDTADLAALADEAQANRATTGRLPLRLALASSLR